MSLVRGGRAYKVLGIDRGRSFFGHSPWDLFERSERGGQNCWSTNPVLGKRLSNSRVTVFLRARLWDGYLELKEWETDL
jgi:hypothetical protein